MLCLFQTLHVTSTSICRTIKPALPITEHNCHGAAGWISKLPAALLPSVAVEGYSCSGAVTVKNTGNVRLSSFQLTSTKGTTFTCNQALGSAVLPEGTITCTAAHTATEAQFEDRKFTLGVAASATAFGTNAAVTVPEVTHDVTLSIRQTGTVAVTHSAPATPVTAVGEGQICDMPQFAAQAWQLLLQLFTACADVLVRA